MLDEPELLACLADDIRRNVSPADGEDGPTKLLAMRLKAFDQGGQKQLHAQLNEQALQQVQQQQQLQAQLNQKALDQAERMCAARDAAVMCEAADVLKVAEAAEAAQAMPRAAQEAQEPAQLQEQQPTLATAPQPSMAAVAGLVEEDGVEEEAEEQQQRGAAAISRLRQEEEEEVLRLKEKTAELEKAVELEKANAQREAQILALEQAQAQILVQRHTEQGLRKALDAANSRVAQMERERQLFEQKGAREAEKLKAAREALAKKGTDLAKKGTELEEAKAKLGRAERSYAASLSGQGEHEARKLRSAQDERGVMELERNTALSEASAWEARFSEQNLETSGLLLAATQRETALEARLQDAEERCQAEAESHTLTLAARIEAQSHREEQAVRIEHSLNQQAAA